ncbi:DUF805 domain-containing protein [Microbulbifer halophilus]|uniref:DUF805 domain-containing protein n=1 Tax=Microbulbifer halophilus TaxID=453963 RepID=A0ABW5ECY4_9GAMM|nr:DUF805 domain-containing protein [Microbulbifer halophilus]MCW8125469.1 DUF805 domain-containing protein [Microbulbifer halophilus]
MTTAANPYASPQTTDLTEGRDEAPAEPRVFSYAGRLGRMRLVAYTFYMSLITMPLAWMAMGLMFSGSMVLGVLTYIAVFGVSLVFGLSLYVRRLHDLDQPGIWVLLLVLPLVNLGLMIYLLFFRGTDGANQYGPETTPNSTGVKVGFVLTLVFVVVMPILAAISIPAYQDYVERAQQSQLQ